MEGEGFRSEVAGAEEELERIIEESMAKVKEIKDSMNGLEKGISTAVEPERSVLVKRLRSESDRLNRLSDSLTLTCKDAWRMYAELEKKLTNGVDPSALEGVRVHCKNIDQIAADLLCYSLGH